MRPRTLILLAMLVGAGIVGTGVALFRYLQPEMQRRSFAAFLRNADRVELVLEDFFMRQPGDIALIDPEETRELISRIKLEPKEPCECMHNKGIVFWQGARKLEAVFCDHCFDVITRRANGSIHRFHLYKMPPELYSTLQQLENKYRNLDGRETEPRAVPAAPRR